MLHLDDYGSAVGQRCGVHLGDGRRRERTLVEVLECVFQRAIQLLFEDPANGVRRVSRGVGLERAQLERQRGSDEVGSRAQVLAYLDGSSAQFRQGEPDPRLATDRSELPVAHRTKGALQELDISQPVRQAVARQNAHDFCEPRGVAGHALPSGECHRSSFKIAGPFRSWGW